MKKTSIGKKTSSVSAYMEGSVSMRSFMEQHGAGADGVGGLGDWDDPSLSAADLVKMAKTEPRAYQNPNLSLNILLKAARSYPWYVEQNPVLGLLFLEDPAVQMDMTVALLRGWIASGGEALTPRNQRLFACDCAEHVLHTFEDKYPDDKRPREAVRLARLYAKGDPSVTPTKLLAASNAAKSAADPSRDVRQMGSKEDLAIHASYEAAIKAGKKAAWYAARDAPFMAANAAAAAAFSDAEVKSSGLRNVALRTAVAAAAVGAEPGLTGSIPESGEQWWQAERMRHYYAMEHPDYQPPEAVGKKAVVSGRAGTVGAIDPVSRAPLHALLLRVLGQEPKVRMNYGTEGFQIYVEKRQLKVLCHLDKTETQRARQALQNYAIKHSARFHEKSAPEWVNGNATLFVIPPRIEPVPLELGYVREENRGGITRSGPDRFGIVTYHSPHGSIQQILHNYPHIDMYEAIDSKTLITDWEHRG